MESDRFVDDVLGRRGVRKSNGTGIIRGTAAAAGGYQHRPGRLTHVACLIGKRQTLSLLL